MNYSVKAFASKTEQGKIEIRETVVPFGVTKGSELPSPADLLVSAFASCCLKNVECFSEFMHFDYQSASIKVEATRQDKPPKIDTIQFQLTVKTESKINTDLLMRNLKKFGTIYNTLDQVCEISGVLIVEG